MNPGTWSNAKAFLVTVLLSVLSVASIVAVNTGEFSQGFGLFTASVYGLLASLVLVLGPAGLRKLYAALLITIFVVGWSLYPTLVANGGTAQSFNYNDIGGVTMWFWLIVAALLVVFYAFGYRLGIGSTDSTKADVEIRLYKKQGANNDLRLAFGLFLWRKGHN